MFADRNKEFQEAKDDYKKMIKWLEDWEDIILVLKKHIDIWI